MYAQIMYPLVENIASPFLLKVSGKSFRGFSPFSDPYVVIGSIFRQFWYSIRSHLEVAIGQLMQNG